MHEVIYSENLKEILEQELYSIKNNIQIITAYCKLEALAYIDSKLLFSPSTKRILVRFRPEDIISGATDIEIYNYCKSKGWKLYIQLDLHAKTYIFDKKRWIVGSANLTSKGIGLIDNSNCEIAMLADVEETEIDKINAMFYTATLMTDQLFSLMQTQLSNIEKANKIRTSWNGEIISLLNKDITTLFTHDFPKSNDPYSLQQEDLLTFHIQINATQLQIKTAFLNSSCYRWLKNLLVKTAKNELSFGGITSALHDTLVNDPKPYRKEIKDLLSNLLSWITALKIDEITIEQPNFAQIVKLHHNP